MNMHVTGAKGQLGQELVDRAAAFGFTIHATDMELDITNRNAVEAFEKDHQIGILVNAAAYTQVDRAETEQDLAYAVNRDGPANLAEICSKLAIPLIHISTDYVFDGKKGSPYIETDPVAPLGVYGKSKEEGECAIRSRLNHHIIIRTAWLYGFYGYNFVKTIIRLGKEKDSLRVVSDQYGSPTCAEDLANAILTVASTIKTHFNTIHWGTYHYCGRGITTWHGFAEKILEEAKKYTQIRATFVEPITTSEYPTPAKRPAYSALNCDKIQKYFGIQPIFWQESVSKTIKRILG